MINLSRNKNTCCELKKVVAKSRAGFYFEQQILALLLVSHQTHNLSRNKFARALTNQRISAPDFFNPQQMFLLRVKLITPGEKRETATKTCNATMLRDKLRVFISRFSQPLGLVHIGDEVGSGVGIGIRIARSVTIQCKSKIGSRSGIGSSTESESKGSKEFLFLPIPLPLRSLPIQ